MRRIFLVILISLFAGNTFSQIADVIPDTTLFDKHYFAAAEAEDLDERISHLVQARFVCERAYGTLAPVFLEVCMALGQAYEEKGDVQSAAAIYEDGMVQSIGLYSLNDPDVKEYYETIEQAYRDLRKSGALDNVVVWNRAPQFKRDLRMNDDDPQTDETIRKATEGQLSCINLIDVGKYKEAETLYLQNIKLLENASKKDSKIYRKSLSGLANLYQALHNYETAKKYAGDAKILFEANQDYGFAYIQCLSRCSAIEFGLGNMTTAQLMIDVALMRLFEGMQDIDNETDKVKAFQSITYLISLLNNAAVVYTNTERFNDATAALQLSIALSDQIGQNTSTEKFNLATIHIRQGNFAEASKILAEAYQLAKGDIRQPEIGCFQVLSDLYLHKDASALSVEISKALCENFTDVFSFLSTDERDNYWKHSVLFLPLMNFAIYSAKDETKYGTIYDNILKSKGILLRTSNQIRDAINASGNEDLKTQYNLLLTKKRALQQEQDPSKRKELTAEINSIDKRLTNEVSQYADYKNSVNVNWRQVQQALGDDDIAIEFYNIPTMEWKEPVIESISEARYCAVVIKKGYPYPHIIPLAKEADILGLDETDRYSSPKLFDMIWAPLKDELNGVQNIYFAADKELHKIAIEYAVDNVNKTANEQWNIYRLSSTRELAEKRHAANKSSFVLYGGLQYSVDPDELIAEHEQYITTDNSRSMNLPTPSSLRAGVKYLPGTKKEVEAIEQEIASSSSATHQTFLGIKGTEESFKILSGKAIDVLHLATHGFFWDDEEAAEKGNLPFLRSIDVKSSETDLALFRSGLLMTGANQTLKGEVLPNDVEDGVLTAKELSALNLGNIDLVVLSACQSGLGEVSGDGVFGLQRGFKLAGANTLLMSLWPVDDTATQLLMVEFYKHYLQGGTKTDALRHAQQRVKSQQGFEDPEYWAGFILLDALN